MSNNEFFKTPLELLNDEAFYDVELRVDDTKIKVSKMVGIANLQILNILGIEDTSCNSIAGFSRDVRQQIDERESNGCCRD